jgi:hypothetical protein
MAIALAALSSWHPEYLESSPSLLLLAYCWLNVIGDYSPLLKI